jgi:hypothetical protein
MLALKYWKEMLIAVAIAALLYLGYSYRGLIAERDSLKLKNAEQQAIIDRAAQVKAHEQAFAITQNDIAIKYEQGKEDGKNELSTSIQHLRTAIGLRDKRIAELNKSNANLSSVDSSSGIDNGEARPNISQTDGEFYFKLASEADEVAKQLSACQAIVEEDRKLVNGK